MVYCFGYPRACVFEVRNLFLGEWFIVSDFLGATSSVSATSLLIASCDLMGIWNLFLGEWFTVSDLV
jgi:hypothetical protein